MSVQICLVLIVVLLAALVVIGSSSPPRLASAIASPSKTPASEPWDLDADIGSLIVLSWYGRVGWPTIQPLLAKYKIGGVLLFTPNFGGTPAGVRQWSDRLQALASSECLEHPILTMLDEEGGEVANVKATVAPPWPPAMALQGPDVAR